MDDVRAFHGVGYNPGMGIADTAVPMLPTSYNEASVFPDRRMI